MSLLKILNRQHSLIRGIKTTPKLNFNVAIVGASGGIGQPLSLLLKLCPLVKNLNLHDLNHTHGVAADLSHINTRSKIRSFVGPNTLEECIKGAHFVVVPAGAPRKPGMTRDDLFNINAKVALQVAKATANAAPEAFLIVVTNPVNVLIPIMVYTYEKIKKGNPNRIFGVTTLDVVRTKTFIAELKGLDPTKVDCPCVGGHAGETIIPLLSQFKPNVTLSSDEIKKLTKKIQEAGTEVVKAKAGAGSATLSIALATSRFTHSLMEAAKGETNIVECSYVKSNINESPFFSSMLLLGRNGIEKNLGIPKGISAFEKKQIDACVKTLKGSAKKGKEFVDKNA